MKHYEKIRGTLTEGQNIPRRGFVQQHQTDPREKRDTESARAFAAQPGTGRTHREVLNWHVADAQRNLDAATDAPSRMRAQAALKLWTDRVAAHAAINPATGTKSRSAENASTEIDMTGYERLYEMILNEVLG